jgi:hypothetical protein
MKPYLAFLALAFSAHAAPPESFWAALHTVETGGRLGPILGDNGRSLGPLQCSKAAFIDSKVAGSYEQVADLAFARKVAEAYLQRYAPEAYRTGDAATLARVWNGGPKGASKSATLPYSRRVLAAMARN